MKFLLAIAPILVLALACSAAGAEPSRPTAIPDSAFHSVVVSRPVRLSGGFEVGPEHLIPTPSPVERPRIVVPVPTPVVVVKITPKPVAVVPTVAQAKSYALSRIGSTQYACLDKLFTRESNWNPTALNSSSGAYGIPQALPGDKMATAGADWRTNPVTQVKWGLGYIGDRYGTACGAWAHSQEFGWY